MKNKLSLFFFSILCHILFCTITVPGTGCDSGKTFLSEPHCAGCCLCVDLSQLSENKHSIFLSKISSHGYETFGVISYFYNRTIITFCLLSPHTNVWNCLICLPHKLQQDTTPGITTPDAFYWQSRQVEPLQELQHICECVYMHVCVCVGRNRLITMGGVEWCLHIWHVSGLALLFPRCVNVTKRDCA